MTLEVPDDVTQLLINWSDGDRSALDELMPVVRHELHRIARSYMRGERADHTLQTTALINEAYIKLVDQNRVQWQSRTQFYAICARIMRRILVDHARKHRAAKRGEGKKVTLPDVLEGAGSPDVDLIDLEDGLVRLEKAEPRQAETVELRYFADLRIAEIAGITGRSQATVKRDLTKAKDFLHDYLHH